MISCFNYFSCMDSRQLVIRVIEYFAGNLMPWGACIFLEEDGNLIKGIMTNDVLVHQQFHGI